MRNIQSPVAKCNTYPIRYSVIIPHKDIPDLLDRLLHSIPKREDVEIFVVDDNSDPKIMAGYKELEGVNYRYTHESCGAGYARNLALREARGVRLGRQYNAGLFSAFCAWLKSSLFSRRQHPVQQKESYITYLKKEDD